MPLVFPSLTFLKTGFLELNVLYNLCSFECKHIHHHHLDFYQVLSSCNLISVSKTVQPNAVPDIQKFFHPQKQLVRLWPVKACDIMGTNFKIRPVSMEG